MNECEWWEHVLAFFRISKEKVCKCSQGYGLYDYHDYSDAGVEYPPHFFTLRCDRCEKRFRP